MSVFVTIKRLRNKRQILYLAGAHDTLLQPHFQPMTAGIFKKWFCEEKKKSLLGNGDNVLLLPACIIKGGINAMFYSRLHFLLCITLERSGAHLGSAQV